MPFWVVHSFLLLILYQAKIILFFPHLILLSCIPKFDTTILVPRAIHIGHKNTLNILPSFHFGKPFYPSIFFCSSLICNLSIQSSIHLSFCWPVSPYVHAVNHPHIYPFVWPSIHLSVHLSVHLSINHPLICPFVCPSVSLPVHPSTQLSIHLFAHLSGHPSVTIILDAHVKLGVRATGFTQSPKPQIGQLSFAKHLVSI